MPKIQYKNINFRSESLRLISIVDGVITEYSEQGYDLTLRQVYYQLVARDYIPNNERSYKNIGNLINDARLAGLIDWTAIHDRTRNIRKNAQWESPQAIIDACASQYRIDTRIDQPTYIEVWVEKDALIGIVESISSKLDIPCFSCRGYVSASEMWAASRRFIRKENCEQRIILHLGDHDPSGKDMTRDIQERLELFGSDVDVRRIALNYDQIEEFSPPPNPTKLTDSRATSYINQYGYSCWELDALEPNVLTSLINDKVANLTDYALLNKMQRLQKEDRCDLKLIKDNWESAMEFLRGESDFE